ncbi:MAG: 2Fe-2S iron-sulfur cluster binding domain-containing protein, partial [Flexistipes sinusarabici]
MTEILLGIVFFVAIILLLVGMIIQAKRRLVPSGVFDVVINDEDDEPLKVAASDKLLFALADNDIYVPSACGGGGTCGQCKVKVDEGGGEILPTEKSHINIREAKEGYRLSCQLSVKNDL